MKRLAVVLTHPIQYYVPVFQRLGWSSDTILKVFYTGDRSVSRYDAGFKKNVEWDLPLLEGYDYQFVNEKEIIQTIRSFNPHAILIYGWSPAGHLRTMRFFNGNIPVWFRGDSTLLDPLPWYKKISRYVLLNWIYKRVDKAFYVGSANKEYFIEYGLKEQQLIFAPHAIDNQRFSQDRSAEATALRDKLKIMNKDILILFAGKLESKKAPLALLRAFKELDRANVHLLFTGSGELERDLKAEADDHPRIHFSDFVNQSFMPVYYQACDLFCLPSVGPGETWGLAVNEAMASGKAVLVSNRVGCAKDLVKNHYNGLIFDPENPDDLKNALSELLSDSQKLIHMGKSSGEQICAYTFDHQVKAIEQQLRLIADA